MFAGPGFRCPLTEFAGRCGAQDGSVTDIYLPNWFAHNMPTIHAALIRWRRSELIVDTRPGGEEPIAR